MVEEVPEPASINPGLLPVGFVRLDRFPVGLVKNPFTLLLRLEASIFERKQRLSSELKILDVLERMAAFVFKCLTVGVEEDVVPGDGERHSPAVFTLRALPFNMRRLRNCPG